MDREREEVMGEEDLLDRLHAAFAGEEGSFLGQLRGKMVWDQAAFDSLVRDMRDICELRTEAEMLERWQISISAAGADGFFFANTCAMTSPARARASPSNTMKRHGVSLPWSGTRAPMVRMVSSSSAVGPGPLISRGLTERRIFRSSMASGTTVSFVGLDGRIAYHGDRAATKSPKARLDRL